MARRAEIRHVSLKGWDTPSRSNSIEEKSLKDPILGALAVVMRSVRYPHSALSASLALMAERTASSAVALLALCGDSQTPEVVAVAGRAAARFGPPGPAPWADARFGSSGEMELENAYEGPWIPGERAVWSSTRGDTCLFTLLAVGHDPDPVRLEELSGLPFILGELIMAKRTSTDVQTRLKAERQDRALLAASLQHDLRTPLSGILGFASILRSQDDMGADETTEILELLAAEAEHMAELVAEGLRREESGPDTPLRLATVDPLEIAQNVAEAARQARGGEVIIGVGEHKLVSDKARLTRALLNLVDNAIKYSPEGSPVRISGSPDGGHYHFVVADSGPGVPEDMVPTLFQPYTTDPLRTDGTGLGLHSVATIASELNGRVSYARRDGWTTFSLSVSADGPEFADLDSAPEMIEARK